MGTQERLFADYRVTDLTIGRHPMAHRRVAMDALGVTTAQQLANLRNETFVRITGAIIIRQRPGTAKGFVFLSMEDETGVMNTILTPTLFAQYKVEVLSLTFLLVEGTLQNINNVIAVNAARLTAVGDLVRALGELSSNLGDILVGGRPARFARVAVEHKPA